MTEQHHDAGDPRARYERTRDDFGRALFAAAEAKDAPATVARASRRRRGFTVGGIALAGGLAALAIGITLPGGDGPSGSSSGRRQIALGAAPAVAAVTAIRDALHSGVLVRDAVTTSTRDGESRQQDWTDLLTRDQHFKASGGVVGATEFWNPGEHERWSIDSPTFVAKDGRKVASYTVDRGSSNQSATESPVEEVERLLRDARAGKLTVRNGGRPGERVLELRQECYSTPDDAVGECPEPGSGEWPRAAPDGMRAVINFQRWWIGDGEQPRMVRYDQGELSPKGTDRLIQYTVDYRVWKVLPRDAKSLALVQPPKFDPSEYLVLKGGVSVVSDATRKGEVICTDKRPGYCPS